MFAPGPQTQQPQGGMMPQGPDQATALFEQGLSDMAYQLLTQHMPDLISDVITFKVLSTDVEKGDGVGAFIIAHGDAPIYVPVVMAGNAVKPLAVMYHKALNTFLPLSKGWLGELDKTRLDSLGVGVKTPDTLYTDVDIRNVVVPPINGRYSYASWHEKAANDVARVLSPAGLDRPSDIGEPSMLLPLLSKASNGVKRAFVTLLSRKPVLMKTAASIYGVSALASALAPTIEKAATVPMRGLWIADANTSLEELRQKFQSRTAEAYASVRSKGYAARDDRQDHHVAYREQPFEDWIEPTQPGTYILHDVQGTKQEALVMPNPLDVFDRKNAHYGSRPSTPGHNPILETSAYAPGRPDETTHALRRNRHAPPYLAVFNDGNYLETEKLVGQASSASKDLLEGLPKRMLKGSKGEPRVGKGFFVRQTGTTFQATTPMEIKSIATATDGSRRITATSVGGSQARVITTDPRKGFQNVWIPKDSSVAYLPGDFAWVPLKERLPSEGWFRSATDLSAYVSMELARAGARSLKVADAGAGQFSIGGTSALSHVPALAKLARDFNLTVPVAEALLGLAKAQGKTSAWVMPSTHTKDAQARIAAQAPTGEKQPEAEAIPENGSPLDAGIPPLPPPPPSPVEMAAMEMEQALQQETQRLNDKRDMLAAIVRRSQEIAGGAPPSAVTQSQAMGAPPPTSNLATGEALPPTSNLATGDALPGAGAMEGGIDTGSYMEDPGLNGPMQDPQALAQEPAAPRAMMPPNGPNANSLETEVNPRFLEQAAQLHSVDMFDAAAVAMLAQSPELYQVARQYVPNLEKALDNLARVMLTLWMQEGVLKERVGEETFDQLEQSLSSTFKNLGALVLRLARGVQGAADPDMHAPT